MITHRPYSATLYTSSDPDFQGENTEFEEASQQFYEQVGFQAARLAECDSTVTFDTHVFAPDDMVWYEVRAVQQVIKAIVRTAPDVPKELEELMERGAKAAGKKVDAEDIGGES